MNQRYYAGLLLLLILIVSAELRAGAPKNYLSNLSATRGSPLYTTYAAAMERSEFTLDEGYHLTFYDSARGVDFTTDTGGDWCLAFRQGNKIVYRLNELHKEPVISVSYPDMVSYYYYPFENILVEVTFLVHSSRLAIQDIKVANLGEEKTTIQVIPFLQNNYRTYDRIDFQPARNAVLFSHEELPDGWVLEHEVPYVDHVRNVFMVSKTIDNLTCYRSYGGEKIEIPKAVRLEAESQFYLWGTVTGSDGERVRQLPPQARLVACLNDDYSQLITENSPVWGRTDPGISRYGVYGMELGALGTLAEGSTGTVRYYSEVTGEEGTVQIDFTEEQRGKATRQDMVLSMSQGPKPPANFRRDIWGSGKEVRLYWDGPDDIAYNIYRRNYRESDTYVLLKKGHREHFYTDKNLSTDAIYGYLVTAVDTGSGRMSMPSSEVNNLGGRDFLSDLRYPEKGPAYPRDLVKVISASVSLNLKAGSSEMLRVVRAVCPEGEDDDALLKMASKQMKGSLKKYLKANEQLFKKVPDPDISDPDLVMLYWSAFNLMRQVMLPPEGKCGYNYYVFSREPTWGWGHGGQVFHESLTMMAYAHLDPEGAMNSQRVYRERQYDNGYINYRTGSYLDEIIPVEGQLTTSAPWYSWINWEVYKITGDRAFLEEMYESSKAYYNYYANNRDTDEDGFFEWGAHAVLESVRDGMVAVWDEVAWPSNFEAVDLNTMMVREMKALAAMARELGQDDESSSWNEMAEQLAERINTTMWDEKTGFYYHVDKKDHDFTYEAADDLKREEIIGFLPLWAGIASREQAEQLVAKLTDPSKFWRPYGVPSLAADDSYYNPKGYWNGPVWVEWNFLIVDGLLQYGYEAEARELVRRVAAGMIAQLKKDHNLWEFYSPDEEWAGYHKTYIWAGIINRMLMDVMSGR